MTILLIWIAGDMVDYKYHTLKTFKCGFCQQEKPEEGSRWLIDVDSRAKYWCAGCMKNKFAQKRWRIAGLRQFGWWYNNEF